MCTTFSMTDSLLVNVDVFYYTSCIIIINLMTTSWVEPQLRTTQQVKFGLLQPLIAWNDRQHPEQRFPFTLTCDVQRSKLAGK